MRAPIGGLTIGPSIAIDPRHLPPGTIAKVSGKKFSPRARIKVYLDGDEAGQVAADRAGNWSGFKLRVPSNEPLGQHHVTAVEQHGPQATLLVGTDWDQAGFDSTGCRYNPYETILSPVTVAGLAQSWTTHIPTTGNGALNPVVSEGKIFIASDAGTLYALDARAGSQLWTQPSGGIDLPAVADGTVFAGASFLNALRAFNAATGSVVWTAPTGSWGYAPIVSGNTAFLGCSMDRFFAFDAANGKQLWFVDMTGAMPSAPAVSGGSLFVADTQTNNTSLYAFDAATGALLWRWVTPGTNHTRLSPPAVANGLIYTGCQDHNLYAVDAKTGTLKWQAAAGNAIFGSPAVGKGMVYVGSNDNKFYAFDALTGAQRWSAATGGSVISSPALANGVIYVGSNDHKIRAFDAKTGVQLWFKDLGAVIRGAPVIADGVLYVGTDDGHLFAFSL